MLDRELGDETILAALMGISEMMSNLTDVEELLDTLIRIAPPLAGVTRCEVFLRHARAGEFRVAHAFSPDPEEMARLMRLAIRESDIPALTKKVVEQRIPVMFREGKEPMLPVPILQAFHIRSMLIVPLAHQDEPLGFMALDEPSKDHVFTSREVNVVNAIAAHAAIALVHARLSTALKFERSRAEALADALADGVVSLDGEGRIVSLNRGAEELFGVLTKEVKGQAFGDAIGAGLDATDLAQAVLAGEPRATATLRVKTKAGGVVTCLATAAAVPGPGESRDIVVALHRVGGRDS